jgi:hypothetical protein
MPTQRGSQLWNQVVMCKILSLSRFSVYFIKLKGEEVVGGTGDTFRVAGD